MNNQTLFNKYFDGSHWENHPTIYAEEFLTFLKKQEFIRPSIKFTPDFFTHNLLIVDLGCGNGRDVNYFNESGIHAIGYDSNEEILEVTRLSSKWPGAFYPCDIHQLPSQDEMEWAYYCINVMAYVDAPKVLSEIHRTLKSGGFAFIHFNLLIVDQNYEIDYHQKKSDVYELLKDFEIVEEKIFLREDKVPMPHLHHIIQVIIKKVIK
ncbi:MAG: class I SAM-dependent methyltransferase [candidate division SR1 bacterium]|nr:class I SAM-dependent methyltransferase [candidate division SR1 bacterium]